MRLAVPPEIKVYEAYSALADGRFAITGQKATVTSSNGAKTYEVAWQDAPQLAMTSNDNGTYYMDYVGYPLITVLMATGKIVYDAAIIPHFAKIDWNALNKRLNNDYDLAVKDVLDGIGNHDVAAQAKECTADILRQLAEMPIARLGNKEKLPPA